MLSRVLPLLSRLPSPPSLLSSPHSWSWLFYTLIFCKLYLITLLFPETWRKTSYTLRLTHGQTHSHTPHNYLVARFAGGPRTTQSKLSWKDCHDNAERMDTKKGEGRGWVENRCQNLCFLHSYICRLRERRWSFCEPTERKKNQREDA